MYSTFNNYSFAAVQIWSSEDFFVTFLLKVECITAQLQTCLFYT